MFIRCLRVWKPVHRRLSTVPPTSVFNTLTKIRQKARAALAPDACSYDYLREEIARRLCERLQDTSRQYEQALDFGCGAGHLLNVLRDSGNSRGIKRLHMCDIHEEVLNRVERDASGEKGLEIGEMFVFGDESTDQFGNLKQESLDLVMSGGTLHWVNDLPGLLARLNGLLKPDGLFLGAMLGGGTLQELRIAMQIAEEEIHGGISVHVSPMVQVRDVGSVLGRGGFELTTVDVDEIIVPFPDMMTLIRHLKGMGENNAVAARKGFYSRRAFAKAGEIYEDMFGYSDPNDPSKKLIRATFHVIFMIGWKRAASQVKPSARGSAEVSLADLSKALSRGTEDK